MVVERFTSGSFRSRRPINRLKQTRFYSGDELKRWIQRKIWKHTRVARMQF